MGGFWSNVGVFAGLAVIIYGYAKFLEHEKWK